MDQSSDISCVPFATYCSETAGIALGEQLSRSNLLSSAESIHMSVQFLLYGGGRRPDLHPSSTCDSCSLGGCAVWSALLLHSPGTWGMAPWNRLYMCWLCPVLKLTFSAVHRNGGNTHRNDSNQTWRMMWFSSPLKDQQQQLTTTATFPSALKHQQQQQQQLQ